MTEEEKSRGERKFGVLTDSWMWLFPVIPILESVGFDKDQWENFTNCQFFKTDGTWVGASSSSQGHHPAGECEERKLPLGYKRSCKRVECVCGLSLVLVSFSFSVFTLVFTLLSYFGCPCACFPLSSSVFADCCK